MFQSIGVKYMKAYRLLSDIKNPEFDGRCRYGAKSIKTFIQGTVFQGRETKRDDSVEVGSEAWYLGFSPAYACGRTWHVSGTFAETLMANSEECQPTTWKDLSLSVGGYEHLASDVLEELLSSGVVSIDQVKKALTDYLAKPI